MLRIRHTMARFAKNHDFPNEGDGTVVLFGQAPSFAWHGSRWKSAFEGKTTQTQHEE